MSDERMPVVVTDLAEYRVATAELPLSTRLTEDREGAVVVVPGDGDWSAAVTEAASAGAQAVVVVEPQASPPAGGGDGDVPVVVERRLLPDALRVAVDHLETAGPRAIVVEAAAAAADLRPVLRDAVGWARVLGGPIVPGAAASTDAFVLAHGTAGGVPVTISVTVLADGQGSRVRATAIGALTTEVVVDPLAGTEWVQTASTEGLRILPARFESTARATLRRALAADGRCADLDELRADATVADAFLGA
jgi:hypothetical protein